MPFIGQFCLTDLGDFSTSDLVNVYSNVDGYANPINTEPILISYMTGDGCPFTLAGVPDGTTQLYIINTDEDVCTYLPVQSSDLCENCSFGFTQYSAQSIGRLYVGLLSASCENNLTGYTIDWYNENGEIQFTSGIGSPVFDYEYQQPALGAAGIFVPPGTYYPVINSISLSGITFTSDDELYGVQVVSLLDCLPAIEVLVEAYACDDGGTGDCPPYATAYTHCLVFSGSASNIQSIPEVQQIWLELTPSTNYIAFSFNGVDVVDDIKVVYSGVNYDNAFLLDWFKVGTNNSPSSDFTTLPILIDPVPVNNTLYYDNFKSRTFKKVICMTGFTNIDYANDHIIFEVIPNQSNFNTDWYLNFTCLEDFDCESCYLSAQTKIILSSVTQTTNNTGCSPKKGLTFNLTGCSLSEILNDDILTYFNTSQLSTNPQPLNFIFSGGSSSYSFNFRPTINNTNSIIGQPPFNSWNLQTFPPNLTFSGSCNSTTLGQFPNTSCANPMTGTTTFSKTYNSGNLSSTILMTFSNFELFDFYYQSYMNARNSFDPNFTDSSLQTYYETYTFSIRFNESNPAVPCGDNTPLKQYILPKQSLITTGLTQTDGYTLQIDYNNLSNGILPSNCFYQCIQNRINSINNGLTLTLNASSTTGSRVTIPFISDGYTLLPNIFNLVSHYWVTHKKLNEVVPRNYNNTSQLFPEYSSVTCPNIYTTLTPTGTTSNQMYYKNYATHRVSLIDENNPDWFKVERFIPEPVTVLVYSGDPATFNNINTTYVLE
jgi:hypothetical protein